MQPKRTAQTPSNSDRILTGSAPETKPGNNLQALPWQVYQKSLERGIFSRAATVGLKSPKYQSLARDTGPKIPKDCTGRTLDFSGKSLLERKDFDLFISTCQHRFHSDFASREGRDARHTILNRSCPNASFVGPCTLSVRGVND